MTDLLVRATLDVDSGFDGDTVVNTFAFKADVPVDQAVITDIHNAVAGFYNTVHPGASVGLFDFLSSRISRETGACRLQMYDITGHLDGSPAGSPIADDAWTLTGSANNGKNLPPQVAVALTLRGRSALDVGIEGPNGIRPRQRRTGRIYVGPFLDNAVEPGNLVEPRVAASLRTTLLAAAEGLQDSLVDGDYAWCVWSRSNAAMYAITRAEVDDSFDTMRSRQFAPTIRSVRTLAPAPALVLGA